MPKKNKEKRLKIGSFLIFLFLLVYIPSFFNWVFGQNISSDIIRFGTLEEYVNADGIIFRDEVLLAPPSFAGKFIPEISEGERVPAFCRVAIVLKKTSDSLLKELEDINTKIVQARNDVSKKTEFFSEDITKIDNVIGQRVQDIIMECNSNSLNDITRLKSEVDKLMEKKALVLGGSSNNSLINSLIQQKDALQKRIDSNTADVISNYSGIISYVIDGYEQVLNPKAIKDLTPGTIKSLKVVDVNTRNHENSTHVNKPFVKVIKGNELYIASVLDSGNAAHYTVGDKILLRINDIGMECSAVVANKSEVSGGNCVVTVSADRGVDELSALRKVNVDLISSSAEGLKIPLKCLRGIDQNGKKAKIMLIKANCAVEREAEIIYKDNEYAIIKTPEGEIKKTINLYDTYILNPDNIKEGDIINK